jgi:hypothetical protein
MAWPTTSDPRTEFVTLRLTVGEAADLDWLIAATGAKDRSNCLRESLNRVVRAERRRATKQKRSGAPGGKMRGEDD